MSVVLHDALHGFREGRRTETATLEAKIYQKLERIAKDALFQVLLDVHKTYDSLDMERCLEILREYGMGMNLARLLENYRKWQQIVPKVDKCMGTVFEKGRGMTQGNPASPMIFNIVVDAVVRAVLEEVCILQEAQHGMGREAGEINLVFYAN